EEALARLERRARQRAAGVVHEHVDAAERGERRLHERLQVLRLDDVGGHRERPPPAPSYLVGDGVDVRLRPCRAHHVGAGFRESERDAAADPLPRAGDDRDAVGELEAVENHDPPTFRRPAGARPLTSGRSRYVRMPGSARHTYGIAFTQCIAVATMPRFRSSPSAMEAGCRPWNVSFTGGSAPTPTPNPPPPGPYGPRG